MLRPGPLSAQGSTSLSDRTEIRMRGGPRQQAESDQTADVWTYEIRSTPQARVAGAVTKRSDPLNSAALPPTLRRVVDDSHPIRRIGRHSTEPNTLAPETGSILARMREARVADDVERIVLEELNRWYRRRQFATLDRERLAPTGAHAGRITKLDFWQTQLSRRLTGHFRANHVGDQTSSSSDLQDVRIPKVSRPALHAPRG